MSSDSSAVNHYDAIVIGSGAGGAAAAFQLAMSGIKVLILEKGCELPLDGSTLDINRVVHQGEFVSHESWKDKDGKMLKPEEHFNIGGKTKWYGAALLRFSTREFAGDSAYGAHGWPIPYEELLPYYAQAEQLLGVEHFRCEADLKRILKKISRVSPAWESSPLPLALSTAILSNTLEATHFDGFASVNRLKGEAETSFLSKIRTMPNVELRSSAEVEHLLPAGGDNTTVGGVQLITGEIFYAKAILLAAGALHSPRLLARYVSARIPTLPVAARIGRNLKLHLLTALVAISPSRKRDVLRKTMLTVHRDFPHSSLQPLGFDGELIGTLVPKVVPRFIARQIGERAYGFFLQTEDASAAENCVREETDASGRRIPILDYDENRIPQASMEHRHFVRAFRRSLFRIGMPSFTQRIGLSGTAHVCGTLATGTDPQEAVVDARGAVFGLKGVYVVDGSVLPRISRVNPSLSIYAWSLRTADFLSQRLLLSGRST